MSAGHTFRSKVVPASASRARELNNGVMYYDVSVSCPRCDATVVGSFSDPERGKAVMKERMSEVGCDERIARQVLES